MEYQYHELSYMKASLDLLKVKEEIEGLFREKYMVEKKIEEKTQEQNDLTEKCVRHIRLLRKKGMDGDFYCPKKRGISSTPQKTNAMSSSPYNTSTPNKVLYGSYAPNYIPSPRSGIAPSYVAKQHTDMWSPRLSHQNQSTSIANSIPTAQSNSVISNHTPNSMITSHRLNTPVKRTGGLVEHYPHGQFSTPTRSMPFQQVVTNTVVGPNGGVVPNYPMGDFNSHSQLHMAHQMQTGEYSFGNGIMAVPSITLPSSTVGSFSHWNNPLVTSGNSFSRSQPVEATVSGTQLSAGDGNVVSNEDDDQVTESQMIKMLEEAEEKAKSEATAADNAKFRKANETDKLKDQVSNIGLHNETPEDKQEENSRGMQKVEIENKQKENEKDEEDKITDRSMQDNKNQVQTCKLNGDSENNITIQNSGKVNSSGDTRTAKGVVTTKASNTTGNKTVQMVRKNIFPDD